MAERQHHFPEPKDLELQNRDITIHQRYRVVVHQVDQEDAMAKAESISEGCACHVEMFVCYADNRTGESLGEIILGRKFYPCKGAMVPDYSIRDAAGNEL